MENEELTKGDIKRMRVEQALGRKKNRNALWAVIMIVLILLISGWIFWYSRKAVEKASGVYYPNIGQEHIALEDEPPVSYNSNPPTSGAHYGSPANWGVYDYEVNDKFFIHNMEHGGIWFSYLPSVSQGVINDLQEIYNEFNGSKIVMGPRAQNDSDIAIAAWTRLLKIDGVGENLTEEQKDRIRDFYRSYKNKGPEFVPDTMPGVDPKNIQ